MRDGSGLQIAMIDPQERGISKGASLRLFGVDFEVLPAEGEKVILDPGFGFASLLVARVERVHRSCSPACVYVNITGPWKGGRRRGSGAMAEVFEPEELGGEFALRQIDYGFQWGPMRVQRWLSDRRGAIIGITTASGRTLEVYVSRCGRSVRAYLDHKELT